VIVSGGAVGPDTWAEQAARRRGLATKIFRPDLTGAESQGQITRRYHARNQQIVDAADEVFALVASDRRGGTEEKHDFGQKAFAHLRTKRLPER
jgi:hypothetical protein